MHDRFVVVPAAYVFLLRDGVAGIEVLLQLRQNTGYMDDHWAAAAAGHVERGETAYAAARREALEEIGVADLDLSFVTAMQRTRGGEPIDERVDFFFTARSWTGEPRVVEAEKCAELRWCPLADLPHPVVPHELAVLDAILAGATTPYTTFGFTDEPEAHPRPSGRTHGGRHDGYGRHMDTHETDIRDSTPNANGPEGAAGDMGVSSERVGPTGPGQVGTDGVRPTSREDRPEDADVAPEQRPGGVEENPEGLPPKADHPSVDPRSQGGTR
jgi:8-oxo-dGTP diphosphatase